MNQNEIFEATLPEMLKQSCKRFPERTAAYFKGHRLDYQTLERHVTAFAANLHAKGIGKGDRVAIMMPNCPQYVIAYFGILQAGGVVVQINPMAVAGEVSYFLKDSGAKGIVFFAPLRPVLEGATTDTPLVAQILVDLAPDAPQPDGDIVPFAAMLTPQDGAPDVQVSPEDVAVLQYTGGTTGRSKGAMLTHRNLAVNAYQTSLVMGADPERIEKILTVIPLFHVYGMTVCMNMSILLGGELILLPRFDLQEVLETIRDTNPTIFPGVPTMYVAVNAHPQAEEYGISSIRLCASGSAPLPVEVIKSFEAKTNGLILEGYGLSEASPVTHFNPMNKRKPGSVGMAIPLTEARIVDLSDGTTEVPPHQPGELVIRGPQVMKGYWGMTEETEQTLRDGWLYTGDIAYIDEEGYCYIIDRKKDMIITGGYNVYPREVEEVLYQHPAIQEAVVIGVPDEYRGENVKAIVVTKQGAAATEDEVIAFCRERLSAYKVPRIVHFRDTLPKTAVGKILRRTLREEEVRS